MEIKGSLAEGLGIGLMFVLDSQIYPFMLSSTFTARTIVKEKGQKEEVKKDLEISLILSSVGNLIIGYFLKSWKATLVGLLFSLTLYFIYLWRGELLK
jgi:hypothetical protein